MAVYTTIDNPELYFQVVTYTGNATGRTITLDGDEDMQPDLVWGKIRSEGQDHVLVDAVRGVTKQLYASDTSAEQTEAQGLTGFASDGFTLGTHAYFNKNTATYVAWCWKESATAGFDIVSYTGNGTDDTDISHSLSAVPHLIIVKNKAATQPWRMQHKALGETYGMILNDTSAKDDDNTAWSDEAPTSSVFTLGTSANTNNNTEAFIAYLWSEKQGFSKFGSYTGNGNADGPFIYTGFRPAFVITKRSETGGDNWHILDNKRDIDNPAQEVISANSSSGEGTTSTSFIDFLSNGFKCRGTGSSINTDATDYIYIAFAEAPFVNSNGVPCNAR